MSVKSSRGTCLTSWIKDKGHILIALESHFDGSYTGKSWRGGSAITLAGFAADDSTWTDLDEHWNVILANSTQRPKAPYCHMREAVHLNGPFSSRNGWNINGVAFLVSDLLEYLQTIDKSRFRHFSCTIDLEAFRTLQAEGYELGDPVALCNKYCALAVMCWYVLHYPGVVHGTHFFFDNSEPFRELFEKEWNAQKERLIQGTWAEESWKLISTVTCADMKVTPAMQAADMLAWASNRQLVQIERPFLHLAGIMKQIIPSSWIVLGEQRLREEGRKE